jgi:alkanesulfonate monooxygenase SsuD/methylene tetrahydromethanopterin reductase-like flavin-dependent oxidoreductase (luciferase family)
MAEISVHAFAHTDRIAGWAAQSAASSLNEWLAANRDKEVVSVQMQQSTYTDTGGDYPEEKFWVTLLVTVRDHVAEARQVAEEVLASMPDYETFKRQSAEEDWEEELARQEQIAQGQMALIARENAVQTRENAAGSTGEDNP